jgi:hypothetical protein
MIVERTADLQILTDDKQTYYRISYNDEFKYVSWFRREYSILYPVDAALYDVLTQKHFEVSND